MTVLASSTPALVKARAAQTVYPAEVAAILDTAGLSYGVVPIGGLGAFGEFQMRATPTADKIEPIVVAPTMNQNVDGAYRKGLTFSGGSAGIAVPGPDLTGSYTVFAAIRPNALAAASMGLFGTNTPSRTKLYTQVTAASSGTINRIAARHRNTDSLTSSAAIMARGTTYGVWVSYDVTASRLTVGVGKTLSIVSSTGIAAAEAENGHVIGGHGALSGFEGDLLGLFVFAGAPMYDETAGTLIPEGEAFLDDMETAFGATVT